MPSGLTGVATVSSAGASDVLATDPTGAITLEIEIQPAGGQVTTAVQVDATIDADLIGNTPGFAAGNEVFLTQYTGVNFNASLDGLTGGGNRLDGLITVNLNAGYAIYLYDAQYTLGGVTMELIAGTAAESAPGIILPDDYNAITNAKYWEMRS